VSVFINMSIFIPVSNLFLEVVPKIDNRLWLPLHQELDHVLKENALEFLSRGLERAAFDDDITLARKERIVFRLY